MVLGGGGGGGVRSNDRSPLAAQDDLAAHHVRPVEVRRLHAPSLGPLSDDQVHSPLRAAVSRSYCRQTHPIVAQTAVEIFLTGDIGIGQYHDIKADELYRPNGLSVAQSPSVADVIGPEG